MKKIFNNKGFTLIEILSAIVILGILMGMGVAAYTKYRKDTAEKSYDIIKKNAITAAENYFLDNIGKNEVTLDTLVEEDYLEYVQDPIDKDKKCTGKVYLFEEAAASKDALESKTYKAELHCYKHDSCLINPSSLSCKMDEGIETNGKDSYYSVGLAGHDFGNSITMVARVKFNKFNEDQTVNFFGNWEYGGGGIGISKNEKTFLLQFHDGSNYVYARSNTVALTDTWYIVVGTLNEGVMTLYLDGRKIASNTMTGNIKISPMEFYLGGNPEADGVLLYPVDMSIADAIILDRGVTESEVRQYFSEPDPKNHPITYDGAALYNRSFN